MKTAFAHWDHRIAPVFDTARELCLVDADSGRVFSETVELPTDDLPVRKVLRLVELEVATLVCGAISRPMYGAVVAYGIQVIPFVAGDLDEVIQAWLGGKLENDGFSMPGCCERGGRRFRMMQGRQREENTMNPRGRGLGTGSGRGQGQGGKTIGRMGGPLAVGPSGTCVCPQCGRQEPHQRGAPCVERKCSNCGADMARQ
jgi:predicted Fe-Mo cluster-binding NifX family protein